MNCVLLLMWSIHLLGITRSFQGFTMWNVTEYWLVDTRGQIDSVEEVGLEETKGDTEDGIHS